MDEVEVREQVAAGAGRVWELVGDPTRMGEFSPECRRVRWRDGATGPAPGARFRGYNRMGLARWSTDGTVVAWEPGREIVWDVGVLGFPIARWSIRLEPDGADTCTIVQRFTDRRGRLFRVLGRFRGPDIPAHNRRGMRHTLGNLAAAATRRG